MKRNSHLKIVYTSIEFITIHFILSSLKHFFWSSKQKNKAAGLSCPNKATFSHLHQNWVDPEDHRNRLEEERRLS